MTDTELQAIEAKLAAVDALPLTDYGTGEEYRAAQAKLRAEMWPDVRRLAAAVRHSLAPAVAPPVSDPLTFGTPMAADPHDEPKPTPVARPRAKK